MMAKLPLTNLPGKTNWVEEHNALPAGSWIRRAAEHMHGKGMPTGRAIATAVNAAERLCGSGDLNFKGVQQANAKSRAEACAALAIWKAAAAKAKATKSKSLAGEADAVDLAGRMGKVPKQVKVRNSKGTVYTRTIWVNPEQLARARADRTERVKGDAPPIVAPSQTNDHARAGLRRLGPNVYVDGKGRTYRRVGKGNSSSFAPLTPKEAKAVKRVVRRAVAQRAFTPTKR